MAKNLDQAVGRQHFQGAQHVHESADREESLVSSVRKLSQWIARDAVVAASITQLTDNSGGTAGAVYQSDDSGEFSDNDLTGQTTGAQAGAFNTAADLYMDAAREILASAQELIDEIDLGTVDEGPGAATDRTIAALTVAITVQSNDTDATTFATAKGLRNDLLHTQRLCIHVVDDAREAVGLGRIFPRPGRGRFVQASTETLTFADDNPDTITRSGGSFATDGFLEGDVVEVNGTDDNNGRFTVEGVSATVLTLASADELTAEALTADESGVASIEVVLPAKWPGRLGGAATLEIDGQPTSAGANWELEFETATSDITDAVNGSDATSAVLKTEVDALFAELRNNIAFLADNIDAATNVSQSAVGVAAMSE